MLSILFIVIGLSLLILGADKFISGASKIATYLGLSPLVVGIVIVGFGTSAPEIAVSIMASLEEKGGLSIGNAYGSNIANIALILGCVLLMSPVKVTKAIAKKELPLLLGISVLTALLLIDSILGRIDGVILFVCFVVLLLRTLYSPEDDNTLAKTQKVTASTKEWAFTIFNLIFGLFLLISSSKLLVIGASDLALSLGVSEIIIGLTVVALGTSLPELATCIIAVRKNEHDMALGNIIGSNIFNTLAVVSISVLIHPVKLDEMVLHRDITVMIAITVLLFLFVLPKRRLTLFHGIIFLFIYLAYIVSFI